jgi:hypothetical protein
MRQGSILSPTLFNIFLDELLQQLEQVPYGIRVFDMALNCCTYADDVTLFAATADGLQHLINMCVAYAHKYRFKFGQEKSKCVVFGKNPFCTTPQWSIGQEKISTEPETEILGVTFDSSLKYSTHVEKRITACRRRIYGLSSVGMCYPGLSSEVKAYIWNTVGAPMILYGMESVPLSSADLKQLQSAQGSIVKRVMGIPKHSHHTRLLTALHIPRVDNLIGVNVQKLYHRIFKKTSPAQELQSRFLSSYLRTNTTVKNSLLGRLVQHGISPVKTLLECPPLKAMVSQTRCNTCYIMIIT